MKKRKIIVYIATSADGYIARRDGDVRWLDRPRPRGNYGMAEFLKTIDTILWGRKTYGKGIEMGVAGDTVRNGPETRPVALIYYPVRQKVWETLELMVRSDGEPAAIVKAVGDEVRAVDKTIPLAEISTVEQHLWEMGAPRRFQIELFGLFALLASVLAVVGVYGVMAYMVGQRTREIGVRMALGARRGDVLKMILRQGLAPAVLGLIAGTELAMLVMRVMAALLFGITATDWVTYFCVALVMVVTVALAAAVPARRAMRVDPTVALRYE